MAEDNDINLENILYLGMYTIVYIICILSNVFLLSIECAHVTFRPVRPLRFADTRNDSRKHRWEENKNR